MSPNGRRPFKSLSFNGYSPTNKSSLPFKNNEWFLYTKEGCPSCYNAKKLLKNKGIKFSYKQVNDNNKEKIYEKIDDFTNNYRYFPIVFHNGKFIGGYDKLSKKKLT